MSGRLRLTARQREARDAFGKVLRDLAEDDIEPTDVFIGAIAALFVQPGFGAGVEIDQVAIEVIRRIAPALSRSDVRSTIDAFGAQTEKLMAKARPS